MVSGLGITHPHLDNNYFSTEKELFSCLLVFFFFLIHFWLVYPTVKFQSTFSSISTQQTHFQPSLYPQKM